MRRILFAVLLVVADATGAAADSFEDGRSAYERGDYPQVMNLWHPLAAQGDAPAQFNLSLLYDKGEGAQQDAQEAVKWSRKAAEQGHGWAQNNLGVTYDVGQGVVQDFVRARMWYNISAKVSSGDERKISITNRDDVGSRMTAAQIAKAQEMARRCQNTKFKECD